MVIRGFGRHDLMPPGDGSAGESPFSPSLCRARKCCGNGWRDLLPAYEQSLAEVVDASTRLHFDHPEKLADCARQDEIVLRDL